MFSKVVTKSSKEPVKMEHLEGFRTNIMTALCSPEAYWNELSLHYRDESICAPHTIRDIAMEIR
jgi:hypothetical protein